MEELGEGKGRNDMRGGGVEEEGACKKRRKG